MTENSHIPYMEVRSCHSGFEWNHTIITEGTD